MTSDFNTLTFESYQKLSSDEKIKISTFCKLINCNSLESFVEWLSVIPNSQRLEAVKQKDQSGRSILHAVVDKPESERLEAVTQKIRPSGWKLLHAIADKPECLSIILSLLPESERLEAVKQKNLFGKTLLNAAAHTPECLRIILSLLAKEDLLDPEVQHVSSSLRIGICNRVCEFFMTVANYFVGSSYTKKCI